MWRLGSGVVGVLRGRREVCAELDGLLEAVRDGESRVLVLRGEAGTGKSVLLDYVAEQGRQFRVCRVTGVQSEMELAFAGLHRLCAPLADRFDRLPGPQAKALRAALGIGAGPAPDRFLVGLAVLGLLSETARERPLVCLVDDAQWLDRASVDVLAFVARRLGAESVGLLFALRDGATSADVRGMPEIVVEGLPEDDARDLLRSVLPGVWDDRVVERIVAETRGNPLALLELPRELTPAELSSGLWLPGGQGVSGRVQQAFQTRAAKLPPDTQGLLLVAAAEPGGDPELLWRAAEALGVGTDAAGPALAAGLVRIDDRVRFPHPLMRSAVYWAAAPDERRRAHRVLADVTDVAVDPDRRAWHAAQGTRGTSEEVAAELVTSAGRARARGALAAAAAFLARAVELTPDRARRQRRALDAAWALHYGGMPDEALRMLSVVEAGPRDELLLGQADLLRAQITYAVGRGNDAFPLLLEAARHLEKLDAPLARETYLDALGAAMFAGPLAVGGGQLEAAEAARAAPALTGPPRAADLLLDGLATLVAEGQEPGVRKLRSALNAYSDPRLPVEDGLRRLWQAALSAAMIWDYDAWDRLATRLLEFVEESGQAAARPFALATRASVDLFAGDLASAAFRTEELRTVSEAVGISHPAYTSLMVAAWRGDEERHAELLTRVEGDAVSRGEGVGLLVSGWSTALLHNSLGRYEDALAAAAAAADNPQREASVAVGWALAEYVEAAVRCDEEERALDAFRRLCDRTGPSGTDWGLGVEARSRALVTGGAAAEKHYREAVERLDGTALRGELARTRLLYGEWLRRERRQRESREQLRLAHASFTDMGMAAFSGRASRELLATGEKVHRDKTQTAHRLTAQEVQIVRLVREGLTNTEIGVRIFISPRTVEWHLGNIFAKLGVSSRKQLQLQPRTPGLGAAF
ncbi:helix-turn-helix transcriptional regulator [Streptomyces justiciae]|uniref:AAA family ATPase n=1 Tax=Streptomyces justiciae TaxID=2780140 RepID=A0ABU3M2C4_9ACTN|nr:AAA family ATPase [Streptomyces justiciae]MDT7845656.1 AAA family ATPase [Streptomyces justiciae]